MRDLNPGSQCLAQKMSQMVSNSSSNHGSGTDMDQSLMSFERLDRNSPDLWPEQFPGVSDFAYNIAPETTPPKWLTIIDKEDSDMLQEFGSLSPAQLVEKIRGLQELAFQLGLEEAHEMVRGKFLNILSRPQKQS